MSSSLSASQLHTVNMRDPLNRVLGESSLPAPETGLRPRHLEGGLLVPSAPGHISPQPHVLHLPYLLALLSPPGSRLVPLLTRPQFSFSVSTFYIPSLEGTLSTSFCSLFGPLLPKSNVFSDPSHGTLPSPPSRTANLFLLISSILGSRTAGPHTQFVQWFMEECVDCLEQGSRGSILQFMPFTTVSTSARGRGWPHLLDHMGSASLSRAWGSVASTQSRGPLSSRDIAPSMR